MVLEMLFILTTLQIWQISLAIVFWRNSKRLMSSMNSGRLLLRKYFRLWIYGLTVFSMSAIIFSVAFLLSMSKKLFTICDFFG